MYVIIKYILNGFFEDNSLYKDFNEVFDINPNRGYLLPHEKKIIKITYNSINENYYNITILCQIKNGPMYPLKIIAGYSEIKYSINKKILEYNIHYKTIGEDIITLQNILSFESTLLLGLLSMFLFNSFFPFIYNCLLFVYSILSFGSSFIE